MSDKPKPSVHRETFNDVMYVLKLAEDNQWLETYDSRHNEWYQVCADSHCDATMGRGYHPRGQVEIPEHTENCQMVATLQRLNAFVEIEMALQIEAENEE